MPLAAGPNWAMPRTRGLESEVTVAGPVPYGPGPDPSVGRSAPTQWQRPGLTERPGGARRRGPRGRTLPGLAT